MDKLMFEYTVTHPVHGMERGKAADKLGAVQAAAKLWGVSWTSIARECDIKKGKEIKPKTARKKRVKSVHK